MTRLTTTLVALTLSLTLSAARPSDAGPRPDQVTAWNAFTTQLLTEALQLLQDSRVYAIEHIAIHDALNTIRPRYAFKVGACPVAGVDPRTASADAAVAAAARTVLLGLSPGQSAAIEDFYTAALAGIPPGPARDAGVAVGEACASRTLQDRGNDGLEAVGFPYSLQPTYTSTNAPGDFQAVPFPGLPTIAWAPGWGNLEPFAIVTSEHPTDGPDHLASFAYALDFNFSKAIGRRISDVRTPEQSQIADFWFEGSPAGWNRIANAAVRRAGLDAWDAARVLALVNFAIADGYIAGFAAKYEHRFWRPITAIQRADTDGNPFTAPEADWQPYCLIPSIPDYPSTHTALGAAAATVLIHFFGDHTPFSTTSATLPGVTRAFRNFTHAAVENGASRVYCGIHFVRAVADGYGLGQGIGRKAARDLPRRR
jgi:membrane-associated phospholipid phosphatase